MGGADLGGAAAEPGVCGFTRGLRVYLLVGAALKLPCHVDAHFLRKRMAVRAT